MRQMLTRQKGDWGLGFGLQNTGAQLLFGHNGGNEGYRCDLEAYAETGQGIAIMTNSDSGGALYSEYLRAVAKEYHWLRAIVAGTRTARGKCSWDGKPWSFQ